MKTINIFLLILVYRFIIGFFINLNTEYPDEYWQGPEVAHYIHYGYGYLTWQWKLQQPLRNALYPWLLSLFYYLLPESYAVYGPKVMHTIITAFGDIYLIKIIQHYYPHLLTRHISRSSNIKTLLFFFGFSYGWTCTQSRTYFNSFETTMTVIAFYYWLKSINKEIIFHSKYISTDLISRFIVVLCYISRPTSLILWAIVWPYELIMIWLSDSNKMFIRVRKCLYFILKNLVTIIIMIFGSLGTGYLFFGKMTLTQLNFIKYNFIEKWSLFYGQEPLYFYLLVSLPMLMGISFLLLIFAFPTLSLIKQKLQYWEQQNESKTTIKHPIKVSQLKTLLLFCVAYLLISCLSTHKQNRFILPIVPFLMVIAFYSIINKKSSSFYLLVLGLIVNSFLIGTLGVYGKHGEEIMMYLQGKIDSSNHSLVYFAEGHSLPGLAYIHQNIDFRIPDSSPHQKLINKDEDQMLRTQPLKLWRILNNQSTKLPDYIIADSRFTKQIQESVLKIEYIKQKNWRFCTIWQQWLNGYHEIILFRRTHK